MSPILLESIPELLIPIVIIALSAVTIYHRYVLPWQRLQQEVREHKGASAAARQTADRWFDAFNRQDLDALLALYHEDAEHFSPKLLARRPETGGRIRGKEALRAWWADAFGRMPELRYAPQSVLADGDEVFMEYVRSVPGEPDMTVGERLRLRDGKIASSKVFHG